MIILEQASEGVSSRALSLFAAKIQRALGLSGEVTIVITSSRKMRELNRAFLNKDKPTDVLSFPAEAPAVAGDIAISMQIANESAKRFGHPVSAELKILILHGLLHLAGYDHESDGGEMQAREGKLRTQFGLTTTLIDRAIAHSPAKAQAPAKRKLRSGNRARGKRR